MKKFEIAFYHVRGSIPLRFSKAHIVYFLSYAMFRYAAYFHNTEHLQISYMNQTETTPASSHRFVSLDFLRGFIMVLLALESAGLYEYLSEAASQSAAQPLVQQAFHHPWNGLHFWDLIQPGFMFIAGTALAFSLQRQWQRGVPCTRVTCANGLARSWYCHSHAPMPRLPSATCVSSTNNALMPVPNVMGADTSVPRMSNIPHTTMLLPC